jgi:hypothetical protein
VPPTVSPHSNRESALGGNALERDRNAPRQTFPARVLRNAPPAGHPFVHECPSTDEGPTADLCSAPDRPSSSAISKSLRSTAMAATNGVNDQVFRWQRTQGYRLRFPEARKPGAQRATEKALGWARVLSPDSKGRGPNLLTAETITPTRRAKVVIGDAAGSGLRAQESCSRRQPGMGVPVPDSRSGCETVAAGRLLLRA